jgi:hypothetical protein
MTNEASEREVLLRCPFCGGPAYVREVIEHYPADADGPAGSYSAWFHIGCDMCGIEVGEEYESSTAALWNRRAAAPAVHAPHKLWLWKNFVDGKPEYWAFDNPYPTRMDCGDPQTLGQPCGYALFKPSRDGSHGRTEEQVLREMASVASLYAAAPTAAQPNTDGVAIPQSKQEN